MDYYDGLSEKEIHYIDEARIIGRTEANSKRLSDLCHKAYADYARLCNKNSFYDGWREQIKNCWI